MYVTYQFRPSASDICGIVHDENMSMHESSCNVIIHFVCNIIITMLFWYSFRGGIAFSKCYYCSCKCAEFILK
uniref:Uncharacterized protein n=1 Tax=Arundo donax TaxID=35708 RepID=A0A0A9FJW3_ARUDO